MGANYINYRLSIPLPMAGQEAIDCQAVSEKIAKLEFPDGHYVWEFLPYDTVEDVRDHLLHAWDDVRPLVEGSATYRDTDCYEDNGFLILETGGMSYGNSPTETADSIQALSGIGEVFETITKDRVVEIVKNGPGAAFQPDVQKPTEFNQEVYKQLEVPGDPDITLERVRAFIGLRE